MFKEVNTKLTILHNSFDQTSRDFVDANTGFEVVDWYNDEARMAWLESGGTSEISAFPSVAYFRPEYIAPARTILVTNPDGSSREVLIPAESIPAGIEIIRLPKSIQEVKKHQAEHMALAAVSWVEQVASNTTVDLKKEASRVEKFIHGLEHLESNQAVQIIDRLKKAISS